MSRRRVAVTGLGVVSASGPSRRSFWQALSEGCSGIGPIEGVNLERLRFGNGAMVRAWQPESHFDKRTRDQTDRFTQFALVAAREAVADAGIRWRDELREQTAVVSGSCVGGQSTEDEQFLALYGRDAKRIHPFTVPRIMANAAASQISMEMELTGPSFTMSTACSSANHAIGHAFWMVRSGGAQLALAGGSEAPFSLGNLKAWEAMRVVAPDTCRPFSRDRQGLILGEGAAFLALEPWEAAIERGVRIYAELVGFGMSSDAHHITQPSVEGPARAMSAALLDGEIPADEIDYINAHGTGTQVNDPVETEAIGRVFGDRAERIGVSSTKSMHGHALGAAGALEAVATVLAMHEGLAPPTANFTEPDPECALDVIPNESRAMGIHAALSNSFAFGGMNAVLAFRRFS